MTYLIIVFLIILSGIFSGLTIGFFSLNKSDLKRKAKLNNDIAKKVYAIRKNGNLLLSTLLIGNVAVNSALSIFLGSITSGLLAGILATSLIVIFGEIIPQASFSRNAMFWGYKFSFFVRIVILILYPITFVIAKSLDKILGAELPTIYSKKELIKIIEEHEDSPQSDLDADEEKILKGALTFSDKVAEDIMTVKEKVFLLEDEQVLDSGIIQKIKRNGHSRIPVYKENKDNIIAILYAKDLLNYKDGHKTVIKLARNNIVYTKINQNLDGLLNRFKKSKQHLFIVIDKKGLFAGIVSIEDVIEEILGSEIVDEYDKNG